MSKRGTKLIRVDKEIWKQVEEVLPNYSNPERSRWIYNEKIVKDMEKKVLFIPKKMNKRGSILDLFFLVFFLALLGSIILVTFTMLSGTNDGIQSSDIVPSEVKTFSQTNTDRYQSSFNGAYVFGFVMLCIATLALAALIRVHPIFLVFFIVSWIFLIFIGGIASNVYSSLAESSELASEAAGFSMMGSILTYLPFLIGIIGAVLGIVMFKLWSDAS